MADHVVAVYVPDPGPDPDDIVLVDQAVDWAMRRSNPITEGRFNKASFRAMYTAKEALTAEEELRHHAGTAKSYVLFMVDFTGTLLDIRPAAAAGHFDMPKDHKDCHDFAEHALTQGNGIAAYSMRWPGGSCCAIFETGTVVGKRIVHHGML